LNIPPAWTWTAAIIETVGSVSRIRSRWLSQSHMPPNQAGYSKASQYGLNRFGVIVPPVKLGYEIVSSISNNGFGSLMPASATNNHAQPVGNDSYGNASMPSHNNAPTQNGHGLQHASNSMPRSSPQQQQVIQHQDGQQHQIPSMSNE